VFAAELRGRRVRRFGADAASTEDRDVPVVKEGVLMATPEISTPLDPDRPSPARIWDFMLGGTHNFQSDREAAQAILAEYPRYPWIAQRSRAFLRRCVRYLAAEENIDQFIDLGSGIPTVGNVHEIAQDINPAARVVYVDQDAMAVVHSGTILQGVENAAALQGDLTDPETIWSHPTVRKLIDPTRPTAVLLMGVLHFVADDDLAYRVVGDYVSRLAPGSFIAVSHASTEGGAAQERNGRAVYSKLVQSLRARSRSGIERFFDGLDLVEPGVTLLPEWRPDGRDPGGNGPALDEGLAARSGYCGVARKH
jgi:hypothetical protein